MYLSVSDGLHTITIMLLYKHKGKKYQMKGKKREREKKWNK